MMELEGNVVIDIQQVQSNEVGGSYYMEMEGLMRSVEMLENWDLELGTLISDRHCQIAKWVKTNLTDTKHLYDVWHVAKGFAKKLIAVSNERDCADLRPWVKSTVNHMYWAAVSTPEGQGELILAKWKSLLNHVQHVHEGHGQLCPECAHGVLEGRKARKKWLKGSTKSMSKLEALVCNESLCRDVLKLSGHHQTSRIEAFHSLVTQFAPKMLVFSFTGMLCRTLLAAMHYNENAAREHATTKDRKKCYGLHYPKYKRGGYVVKKILVNATFDYVSELVTEAFKLCRTAPADRVAAGDIPPFLCADFEKPVKENAIEEHSSRFK